MDVASTLSFVEQGMGDKHVPQRFDLILHSTKKMTSDFIFQSSKVRVNTCLTVSYEARVQGSCILD